MNQQTQNQKKDPKVTKRANVLENLRELQGSGAPKDIRSQLMGTFVSQRKYSGEILQGESLQMSEVFNGKVEENKKLKKQISLERRLAEEEKTISEKKTRQLRLQLQALIEEISSLAKATTELAQETQVAAMEAPVNPGVYHITFFENVLSFLKSFRQKIEEASTWLSAANKRAEKKNYWTTYKKKGSSFLLSPDHYLSRAAG